MPEMPAFLANFVEPRFARRARVTEVIEVAPALRRIRFEGASLRGVSFRPGQEVEFRVSDRAFRHYTPMSFDAQQGALEVLFFLHGNGPGSDWARRLSLESPVNILGPGGGFRIAEESKRHVFLGDETALGLFTCMVRAAPQGTVSGAVEVPAGSTEWTSRVGLPLTALERPPSRRGDSLLEWIERRWLCPDDETTFYLVGHTGSILRMRSALLGQGWTRRNIRTKAYWADGKRGL